MATVLRTGRWDGELVHTKRDGTRIVMASRWSLQRDEQERPIGVLETNNDITVRKRAEEELRRSEGFLAQAQRLSLTGSFGWKTSDGTILWSDETYRIFGVDRSTPPTLELVLQLTHPEDRAAVGQTIEHAQRDMQDFEHEYRLLLADGLVKHLHVVARAVRDDSERPEFVGAVMDVTASKRAAEALRTAQAELARASTLTTMGQFAASVAHELRQPLAALAMNGSATLRWLNREVPDLAEAREAAARIVREAQRADEVIRGLRALVAKSGLQREPLELNDAAHEVLELVRGELRRKDVAVQTELDPMLPSVLGDRVQLQQVLLNLIVNAMEAMAPIADRAKVVVVRTERAGPGEVAVAVEDTGPGLDPAAAGRIFDPFFTTKAHGLGMGLSICRSIVEAHGGELSASPRAAGGTRFRFTVPMSAPASTSTAADIQRARVEPSADGLATA
jgi:PAS domain S-box-containing protein